MLERINPVASKQILLLALCCFLMACGGGKGSTSDIIEEEPISSFNLSGSIIVPIGADVDDDVQSDTISPQNNDFSNAQPTSNPALLGGYLSGQSGFYTTNEVLNEHAYSTDPIDIYEVSLLAGQTISLNAFYADDGAFANTSMSLGFRVFSTSNTVSTVAQEVLSEEGVSTLQVTQDDDYYIVLSADTNDMVPLLYTLSISQEISDTIQAKSSLVNPHDNFVPGEVIVKYKEGTQILAINAQNAGMPYKSAVKTRTKKMLGKLGELKTMELNSSQPQTAFTASSISGLSVAQFNALPKHHRDKLQTATQINQLREDPNVEYAEPNYIRSMTYIPSDPQYSKQWHYSLINLPAAWDLSTGSGVTVAVIDTGIASTHVDLDDNINSANGWDFISNIASAGDGDGADKDPEDIAGSFHGSHVAGIIAAEQGNNLGIVGSAFDARIMPLRVLGIDGFGSDSEISQAILYAAGLTNSSGTLPSQKADIINLSLGSESFSAALQSAITAALDEGVIVIAAAGNNASSVPFYPAAFEGVVSVSAVSESKNLASFSNYGSTIDVAAPGGSGINDLNNDRYRDGILSTVQASFYEELQGTSMAAPHVAGVAALMKSIDPTLNNTTFSLALESGDITDNIGSSNFYGVGLINAAKALAWVGQTIPAQLIASPASFSFVGENTQALLSLSNPGEGAIRVDSIVENASWLNIVEADVDDQQLGTYSIQVDRSDLTVGSNYSASIQINYRIDEGDLLSETVSVFLSVPEAVSTANVGNVYVLLTRKADQEEAEENDAPFVDIYAVASASYIDGQYLFNFSNIPSGEYILDASTDNDNDFIVSDQGEAVGQYPLLGESLILNVTDSNLSGLNFAMGYPSLASSSQATKRDLILKKRLPDNQLGNTLNEVRFFTQPK